MSDVACRQVCYLQVRYKDCHCTKRLQIVKSSVTFMDNAALIPILCVTFAIQYGWRYTLATNWFDVRMCNLQQMHLRTFCVDKMQLLVHLDSGNYYKNTGFCISNFIVRVSVDLFFLSQYEITLNFVSDIKTLSFYLLFFVFS